MTIALGILLAGGALLMAAPWLWPASSAQATRPQRRGRIARVLEEAGLPTVTPRLIAVLCVLGALVVASAVWLLTGVAVLALAGAIAGGSLPWIWVNGRRSRRMRARRALWPDVCDHLVAAVRAGLSVPDALGSLQTSAPAPLRPAIAEFARDLSASGRFDESLDALKARFADPMGDRIVETLRMARRVGGGELVSVLRALSASVRADVAIRGEVEARQSWVRGAAVVGLAAPWIILLMLALRPEGAEAYASPQGVALVIGGGCIAVVAYRLMLRAGRLPEPRRWFG